MLFGTCNCKSSAASISRRGLLCTGGAGFVSALIGTLVGTARTARAQTLSSRVPEVDRLVVRIVTDNYFFPYLLSQNDGRRCRGGRRRRIAAGRCDRRRAGQRRRGWRGQQVHQHHSRGTFVGPYTFERMKCP